jgi:hypothetical protein
VGDDELLTARPGLYLVGCGPLAQALLAAGSIEPAGGPGLILGQDSRQVPHEKGVRGALVDDAGEGDVARIDLDALAPDEAFHVVCRYD